MIGLTGHIIIRREELLDIPMTGEEFQINVLSVGLI
jgi:hypothetical protein